MTAPGNVKGEVIVVKDFDELKALGPSKITGKIVCINQGWNNYSYDGNFRKNGPVEVAKQGGVALLLRSVAPFSIDSPHTVLILF